MSEEKLKPCPFCGSEVEYHSGSIKDACICPNRKCLLFARIFDVKLWNTRPIEEQLQEELEDHKSIIDRIGRERCDQIKINEQIQAENERLVKLLKLAYRNWLEDPDVAWGELGEQLCDGLCESMGDKKFQEWLIALKGGE